MVWPSDRGTRWDHSGYQTVRNGVAVACDRPSCLHSSRKLQIAIPAREAAVAAPYPKHMAAKRKRCAHLGWEGSVEPFCSRYGAAQPNSTHILVGSRAGRKSCSRLHAIARSIAAACPIIFRLRKLEPAILTQQDTVAAPYAKIWCRNGSTARHKDRGT